MNWSSQKTHKFKMNGAHSFPRFITILKTFNNMIIRPWVCKVGPVWSWWEAYDPYFWNIHMPFSLSTTVWVKMTHSHIWPFLPSLSSFSHFATCSVSSRLEGFCCWHFLFHSFFHFFSLIIQLTYSIKGMLTYSLFTNYWLLQGCDFLS